jgi:hypothetical protein
VITDQDGIAERLNGFVRSGKRLSGSGPRYDVSFRQRVVATQLEEGAMLLRGFAAAEAPILVDEMARIAQNSSAT